MTREQYLILRKTNDILNILWEYAKERGTKMEKSVFILKYVGKKAPLDIKELIEYNIVTHYDLKFGVTIVFNSNTNQLLNVI